MAQPVVGLALCLCTRSSAILLVGHAACSVPDMKHEATAAASARSCMHEDSSIQGLVLACSDDFKCIVLFQPAPATTLARIGHSNKISLCDGMLPYLWLLAG